MLRLVLVYTAIASLGGGMVANGVFFVTKDSLGFSDVTNLWLAFVQYLPYIPAALLAGRVTARFGARRTIVISIIGMMACSGALAWGPRIDVLIWIIAPLYNICAGFHWPIVESYVTSGRHGPSMRRAIGAFNMVWSSAICGTLWVVAALTTRIDLYFLVLLGLHVVTLPLLLLWPRSPLPHDHDEAQRHTGVAYKSLLISSRWMLPLSYMLMYVISPLLPGIWDSLHVATNVGAMWSSSWMFARVVAFALLAFTAGWHGRFSVPWAGTVLLVGGTCMTLIGPNVPIVIVGLIAFGFGQGVVYYAALYYGMTVERAAVGSGGRHEAIIGFGYCAGPGMALLGEFVLGGTAGMQIAVGALTVAGIAAAVRPMLSLRAQTQTRTQKQTNPADDVDGVRR